MVDGKQDEGNEPGQTAALDDLDEKAYRTLEEKDQAAEEEPPPTKESPSPDGKKFPFVIVIVAGAVLAVAIAAGIYFIPQLNFGATTFSGAGDTEGGDGYAISSTTPTYESINIDVEDFPENGRWDWLSQDESIVKVVSLKGSNANGVNSLVTKIAGYKPGTVVLHYVCFDQDDVNTLYKDYPFKVTVSDDMSIKVEGDMDSYLLNPDGSPRYDSSDPSVGLPTEADSLG